MVTFVLFQKHYTQRSASHNDCLLLQKYILSKCHDILFAVFSVRAVVATR